MRLQASRAVRPSESGSQAGTVLAIDYGRRRIGLAISDPMRWTAAPLATFERKGRAEELSRLREIAARHRVGRIIVGNPLRMDGTAGELAAEAGRFARRVEQALGIPVELVDERLTSWAARRWRAGHPGRARQRREDEIAAAILLDEFLGRERRSEG